MKDHLKHAQLLGQNYAHGVQTLTNSHKRYILCDMAPSNCGKSTVLNAVADYYDQLCNTTFSKITYFTLSNDRWLVVQEKSTGKVILIQTKGDDLGSYSRTLTYMLNTNNIPVDIIICACHPDDKTKDLVKNWLEIHFNYSILAILPLIVKKTGLNHHHNLLWIK